MVARVCREGGADLMGRKNILVLNDEAHHCYRRKAAGEQEDGVDPVMTAEERAEAQANWEPMPTRSCSTSTRPWRRRSDG